MPFDFSKKFWVDRGKMNKTLTLRNKVTLFFAINATFLMFFLIGVAWYAFNAITMETSRTHLLSVAEVVRLHLTESMMNGTIDERHRFLKRLEENKHLRSVHIARAQSIDKQYGERDKESIPSQAETEVLREGKPIFVRENLNNERTMRAVVPYIATPATTTSPNCLDCHLNAKHGDVLGAISLTISTDEVEKTSQEIVLLIVTLVLLFVLISVAVIYVWLSPINKMSKEIQQAVEKAIKGNFDSSITNDNRKDEFGSIARYLNTLFGVLHEGLTHICNQILHLTYISTGDNPNLFKDAMEKVNHLVEMYDFKQTIEDDPTSHDIYIRLIRVIKERFHFTQGAIYEINAKGSRLTFIPFDEQSESLLCAPKILKAPENCRLFRTKHEVNRITRPGVCTVFSQFVENNAAPKHCHLCLPITTSSGIVACVQLIAPIENAKQARKDARFIRIYLKELAPVLESKRLFEDLKRTSLHDPLTGLKNRRFLEEYTETITSNLLRTNQYLTILMLDLDHFKAVNDTYGHDAGDIVLRHLANTIKKILRASDLIIRLGGEEFLVLLLDTPIHHGMRVAENIRKTLEGSAIKISEQIILHKTVSIGAAEFPNAENDFWQAVKNSDLALYDAKETGRNKVVCYDPNVHNKEEENFNDSAPSVFP